MATFSIDRMKNFLLEFRKKNNSIDDMQDRAYDVLDEFGMRNAGKGGVRIIEILNGFGIKTYMDDLQPKELSAYIAIDPRLIEKLGSNRIACVNSKDSDGHKRFAIAHELAHYLFDYDDYKKVVYYDTYIAGEDEPTDEKELRANRFAACLLMPEESFRKKYEELKKKLSKPDLVNELNLYFRVSPRAVQRRFDELGITGYAG